MSTINLRNSLGRPLTNTEVDNNFSNLNNDKAEKGNNLSDLADVAAARTNISVYSKTETDAQAIAMSIALG